MPMLDGIMDSPDDPEVARFSPRLPRTYLVPRVITIYTAHGRGASGRAAYRVVSTFPSPDSRPRSATAAAHISPSGFIRLSGGTDAVHEPVVGLGICPTSFTDQTALIHQLPFGRDWGTLHCIRVYYQLRGSARLTAISWVKSLNRQRIRISSDMLWGYHWRNTHGELASSQTALIDTVRTPSDPSRRYRRNRRSNSD